MCTYDLLTYSCRHQSLEKTKLCKAAIENRDDYCTEDNIKKRLIPERRLCPDCEWEEQAEERAKVMVGEEGVAMKDTEQLGGEELNSHGEFGDSAEGI
jgi:hypothetical protein